MIKKMDTFPTTDAIRRKRTIPPRPFSPSPSNDELDPSAIVETILCGVFNSGDVDPVLAIPQWLKNGIA